MPLQNKQYKKQNIGKSTGNDPHILIRGSAFLDMLPGAIITTDLDGCITFCNKWAVREFGHSLEDIRGELITKLFSDESDIRIDKIIESLESKGELKLDAKIKTDFDYHLDIFVNFSFLENESGNESGIICYFSAVNKYKQAESALHDLTLISSATSSQEFFQILTKHLGDILNVDFAVVGKLAGNQSDTVRSVTVYHHGQYLEPLEYQLKGTPCEEVVGKSIKGYPSSVQKQFPDFQLLSDLEIESYVGAPLFDCEGQALGLIAILNRKPLPDLKQIESLFEIFVTRASAEMERLKKDEAMRRYQSIVSSTSDLMTFIDKEYICQFINEPAIKIFQKEGDELLGKHVAEIVGIDNFNENLKPYYDKCLSGEEVNYHRWVDVPGMEKRFFDVKLIPFLNNNGEVTGIVTDARDITAQKQTEDELRYREKQLLDAQRIARLGFFRKNLDTGDFFWSPEHYRIFGVSPSTFIPTRESILQLIHPDDRTLVQRVYQEIKPGVAVDFEHRIVWPDGETRYIRVRAELSIDEHSKTSYVFGTVLDITDSKEAAQQIELFKHVVNTTDDHVSFIDANYVYQAVSKQYLAFLNKSWEEVVGHTVEDILGKDKFEDKIKVRIDMCVSGQTLRFQDWRYSEGGHAIYMDTKYLPHREVDGTITGVVISARDITERKLFEQQLERYKHIADSTDGYISFVDKDYRYQTVNKKYLETFAKSEEEIINQPVADLVGQDAFESGTRAVLDRALLGETQRRPNWMDIPALGRRYIESMYYPYREDDGVISGVVVSSRDITEAKQAEQEIERYKHIVNSVEDYIAFVDRDYIYQAVNEQYMKAFERTWNEIVGQHVADVIGRELFETNTKSNLDKALSGETLNYKFWMHIPRYGRRYIDSFFYPYRDNQGLIAGVVVTTRDITEVKLARQQIEQYKYIVDATDDYIAFIDKDYVYQAVNRQYLSAFRKTWGELIGHTVEELHGKEVFESAFKHSLDLAFKGNRQIFRIWVHIPRDGQRYIESNLYPYRGEDGEINGVVVSTRDITDARLAEEQIERYKHIVDATDDGIAFVDRNYVYQAVNKKYLEMFEKRLDDIVGHPVTDIHDKELFERSTKRYLDKALAGETQNCQMWNDIPGLDRRYFDNSYFPYRGEDGVIAGVVVRSRDITQAKQVERQIIRYKHIVDSSDDYISFIDADHIYRAVNQQYLTAFQKSWNDYVGKPVAEVMNREDYENSVKGFLNRALDGYSQHATSWLSTPVFGRRFIHTTYNPVRDEDGTIFGVVVSSRDITETKQAQETLQKTAAQLREAQRISHLGFFTAYPELNRLEWSDEVYSIYGVEKGEEISFEDGKKFIHPDDFEKTKKLMASVMKSHHPANFDYRIITTQGEVRYVSIRIEVKQSGKDQPLALIGTIMDISDRKKVEMDLRQSQAQLLKAQNIAHMGFWTEDMSTGAIFWSDELYRVFKVTPDDFIPDHQQVLEMVLDEDRVRVEQAFHDVMSYGNPIDMEYRIVCPDGEIRYVHTQGETLGTDSELLQQVFGTTIDITDRKRTEMELRHSESRLREAQRIAHLGFWEVEIDTNSMYLSDEVFDIYNIKPEDFNNTLADLVKRIHPDDRHFMEVSRVKALQEDIPMDDEYRVIRPDGEIRYVHGQGEVVRDKQGNPISIVGTVIDITERKAAAEALQRSEERLRRFFDAGLVGMTIVSPDGRWLQVNDTFCDMVGYTRAELLNMRWRDITHPDDIKTGKRQLERLTAGESRNFTIDKRYYRKDSSTVYVTVSSECVRNHDNTIDYFIAFVQDITERKQTLQALQLSEERYRALYDDNPTMFFTVNEQGTILSVNEFGAAQLGYDVVELVGQSYAMTFYEEDMPVMNDYLATCFNSMNAVHRWELRKVCVDGVILWTRETARLVTDKEGNKQALIVCEDITEMRKLSEQLSYQASHDALTGLINRREFEHRLQRVLETVKDGSSEHALCYLDLDQFKVINDTCGHVAGDELLHQVGALLQAEVRKRDTLARLGGDEFGILMEHCTLEQASRVASNIRQAIEDFRFAWEERSFSIGVSVGLVPIVADSISSIEVLKQADAACYAAKDAGRNRIHIYTTDDTELAKRSGEMQWVAQINRALEDDRFSLYAQPIVPLVKYPDAGEHYELLLRMYSVDGQAIPPGAFLGAAERYNLSSKLDRWVVDHFFQWLLMNPGQLARLAQCSINLSALSLGDDQFLSYLVDQFKKTGIPAKKICFEITETAAIANLSRATVFIKTLKNLGCEFALDDFGSGLSSFAYLKTLPVDYLKIDGVFVKDIENDPIDLAMVKSINDIGKVMGKQTIAEFVESESILTMLRGMGVDYAQGYFIGQPKPIQEKLLLAAVL